jgi:hypothetical protein
VATGADDGQAWQRWVGAAPSPLPSEYWPRSPEGTVLHRVVREHLATFLEEARARSPHGFGLPGFEKLTAVRAILDHLGLPSAPLPLGKARGPPQVAWGF